MAFKMRDAKTSPTGPTPAPVLSCLNKPLYTVLSQHKTLPYFSS